MAERIRTPSVQGRLQRPFWVTRGPPVTAAFAESAPIALNCPRAAVARRDFSMGDESVTANGRRQGAKGRGRGAAKPSAGKPVGGKPAAGGRGVPSGRTQAGQPGVPGVMQSRLNANALSGSRPCCMKEGSPGVYRFQRRDGGQESKEAFGTFVRSLPKILPGVRIMEKAGDWVDAMWEPAFMDSPVVRELNHMEFLRRNLDFASASLARQTYASWTPANVERLVGAASGLRDLSPPGGPPEFAAAADAIHGLINHAPGSGDERLVRKDINPAQTEGDLSAARRQLARYIADLAAAIQNGETSFADDEPAAGGASSNDAIPEAAADGGDGQDSRADGGWSRRNGSDESETERLYRILGDFM